MKKTIFGLHSQAKKTSRVHIIALKNFVVIFVSSKVDTYLENYHSVRHSSSKYHKWSEMHILLSAPTHANGWDGRNWLKRS